MSDKSTHTNRIIRGKSVKELLIEAAILSNYLLHERVE